MRAIYRGYQIEVKREMCLGGWSMLYFSAYRLSDGYEAICDFEDSGEKVVDKMAQVKRKIDDMIEHPEEYEEY